MNGSSPGSNRSLKEFRLVTEKGADRLLSPYEAGRRFGGGLAAPRLGLEFRLNFFSYRSRGANARPEYVAHCRHSEGPSLCKVAVLGWQRVRFHLAIQVEALASFSRLAEETLFSVDRRIEPN